MDFQNIRPIQAPDHYLDIAFSRAKKSANELRDKLKRTDLLQQKKIEYTRLDIIRDALEERLTRILKDFPDIDNLSLFYQELIKITLDYVSLKKSLGAINVSVKRVKEFHREYLLRFKKEMYLRNIDRLRREFYGRISSVLKRIKNELAYLEECRRIMQTYPNIKKMKTIAITGFPNVGKSTLLTKLSQAKPEIASYAFTTKQLNLGYMPLDSQKIQLIDTPGTLNRLEKMNNIEKQAYLTIKHLADLIIYVFDLTEPFPLKDQEKLLKNLKQEKKQIIIYFSKSDIIDLKKHQDFIKKYQGLTDSSELKLEIKKYL